MNTERPKPITCSLLIFWFSLTITPIETEIIAIYNQDGFERRVGDLIESTAINTAKIPAPTKRSLSVLSLGLLFMYINQKVNIKTL